MVVSGVGALARSGGLMDRHDPPKQFGRTIARQVGEIGERHRFRAPAAMGIRRTREKKYREQRRSECPQHVFIPLPRAERPSIALLGLNEVAAIAAPSQGRIRRREGNSC